VLRGEIQTKQGTKTHKPEDFLKKTRRNEKEGERAYIEYSGAWEGGGEWLRGFGGAVKKEGKKKILWGGGGGGKGVQVPKGGVLSEQQVEWSSGCQL